MLNENEAKARTEKQTGDSVYYAAFDLDFKNPNGAEVDLGDPVKMLKKLKQVDREMNEIQDNILSELMQALGR